MYLVGKPSSLGYYFLKTNKSHLSDTRKCHEFCFQTKFAKIKKN